MSPTQKVVIARDIGEQALSILQLERADISLHLQIWSENVPADRAWLLRQVQGATGLLVTLSEKVDEELLDAAGPSLKVVSTMSVGHDHISLPALAQRGIKLGYTPDVLTEAVADLCIMLALMASRNAGVSMKVVQEGEWPNYPWGPFALCGHQLSLGTIPTPTDFSPSSDFHKPSKVAGFLGFGRIAQATALRLSAFGLSHILYSNSSSASLSDESKPSKPDFTTSARCCVSIATLAAHSDILFVLAPQTPATYHIVSTDFLRLMKPSAVLVNAARGGLLDSDALAKALKEGQIFAAGLDVVEGEPNVTKDHPLLQEPRCIILPHIGSATVETRVGMACLAARNLLNGLLGEPLGATIDLERYRVQ
ncbi:D-isomer specific 2-hydroxyacid dehydrogenase [Gautieria morchelliformis]|nr:D-isomer specific 2-hydroxyacid dehydrogenase [Gautieria morchelliformis]